MAKTQEQEWSKERIQAEMKDLENARNLRYGVALVLGLFGLGGIVAPLGMPMTGGSVLFIVVGIVLVLISIPFFKSGFAKRRQYNELKKRL